MALRNSIINQEKPTAAKPEKGQKKYGKPKKTNAIIPIAKSEISEIQKLEHVVQKTTLSAFLENILINLLNIILGLRIGY